MELQRDSQEGILVQMLTSHAARELKAFWNFTRVMKMLTPARCPAWMGKNALLHLIHEIHEEDEHFHKVLNLLAEKVGGQRAHERVYRAMESHDLLPEARDLTEHLASMFLTDRAGRIHMESLRDSAYRPYAAIVIDILDEEREHGDYAAASIRRYLDHGASREQLCAALQSYAIAAFRCFGGEGTQNDVLAVSIGLKSRSAAQNAALFRAEIEPILAELGIDPAPITARTWRRSPPDPA